MRHIHISTIIGSTVPVETQFRMIHEAGFDGIFVTYNGSEPIDAWAETADKYHLEFKTVHGPFQHANRLWENGSEGDTYLNFLKSGIIDACSRIHADKCIMHVTVGNTAPPVNAEGLARFSDLCDYAKDKHVQLCFENLEPLPHIDAVLNHIQDPFHGFCWDCGHNACYTPHIDMMKKFSSRLKCIHLHDNLGVTQPGNIDYRDDRHFLPFDGILDWNWVTEKLNACNYPGPVTLEVSIMGKPEYRQMPLDAYIREAYKRGCQIREKLN
ncbi:MAG: sugar phosphate isomerase/epimerase [Lachnospiraceae bacterium]|nr:sugar phosphate isomerase/epimerase [Lachnospiraceae bacterium]